jgi:hypothetical protein
MIKYDTIAKRTDNNHAGKTLRVVNPIPNNFSVPSGLNINGELEITIEPYNSINRVIANRVIFFLMVECIIL